MIEALILILVGALNGIFGIVVYRRGGARRLNRLFLVFTLALASWAWGLSLFIMSTNATHAQWYVGGYYAAAMFIASSLLAFVITLSRPQTHILWILACFVPAALYGLKFIIDPAYLVSVIGISGNYTSRVIIHLAHYLIYGLIFIVMMIVAFFFYAFSGTELQPQERKRHVLLAWGLIIGTTLGIFFDLVLPGLGNYDYIAIGPISSLSFILATSYAIVKYSFFELRQAFVRSLSYIILLVFISGVYILSVWTIGNLFAGGGTFNSAFIYFVLTLFAVMTLASFKTKFDAFTQRVFYNQAYNVDQTIEAFGDAIAYSTDVRETLSHAEETIEKTLHPQFILTLLSDDASANGQHVYHVPLHGFDTTLTDRVKDIIESAMDDTAMLHVEDPMINPRLRRHLVRDAITAIVTLRGHGRITGYVVIGDKRNGEAYSPTDIHLINTLADELALAIQNAQRFDEIETFNKRLTREIETATKELRANNARLKKLDAVKDEFVSMASHQLRTPLTSVKGYLSMVLDGDAGSISSEQRKFLTEAFESSERMVRLINDFLNVSRLQTGKFLLEFQPVDVSKIVRQEVDAMQTIAASHGLDITYRQPKRFPTLYLDEGKLRQVIMNFIDNSVYYSEAGETIIVRARVEDGSIIVTVQDHGMGVPADAQKELFQRFFRAENARKKRPDGTGVGLYLAKKIIDAHGGSIVFSSREGHGSTFGFRLPVKKLSKDNTR